MFVARYWEMAIVGFDDNNVPFDKEWVCVKMRTEPMFDELKEFLTDEGILNDGEEIRHLEEISAVEAEDYDNILEF